ncbi:MAG: right-handed parallel beta-helix repeat-containing protein [Candidatus Cloacimonetes bacterium]|nr:right-handed parallel beta-helix repeat-containing protein [Candidatus Cloacimonadota bacterium]
MRRAILCCLILVAVLAAVVPLAAAKPSEMKVVNVTNEQEFLKSIGSNTVINLESLDGGYLVFSGKQTLGMPKNARWEEVFDGYQLVISNVNDLTITGRAVGLSVIMAEPRYANVIKFENCKDIRLENLSLGHTDGGYCTGGVVELGHCQDFSIWNCELWGCGIEGITAWDSSGLTCELTSITDCTYNAMTMVRVSDVNFVNCVIRNNIEFNILNFSDCKDVNFTDCAIFDNAAFGQWDTSYLIHSNNSRIKFQGCAIFKNNVHEVTNNPRMVRFENCAIFQNEHMSWEGNEHDEPMDWDYDW